MPRRARSSTAYAPLAVDLFCGLGGWADGLLAAGFYVVGFDIERHIYGDHCYPAQLVLQDVTTLHGSQFARASLIVASPPCQAYSYMSMPWKRAKQMKRDYDTGLRYVADLNRLFDACFRIQREACEAAGRHIPMVVENVRGAQRWVGRSRWNYGSYHLWGDVPALMPIARAVKVPGLDWSSQDKSKRGCFQDAAIKARKNTGGSWFGGGRNDPRSAIPGGAGGGRTPKRKAASALIAKIPFPLAEYIGRTYYPRGGGE